MKKFGFLFFAFCILISAADFSWHKFYSIDGNCEILFPNKPHHIKQVIPISDMNSYINYNVYLSSFDEETTVCMMIVVDFPKKIDEGKELQSLEGFLNGILNHKTEKKLISASFSEFNDLTALDFLVENQNRLFKGKAIISNTKMYLIAMEYDDHLQIDKTYDKYINSFNLKN